jgi:hypothetical protein
MRGGPGAQTPGNGGMKKHNPVTVELRNLQSLLQCGTRRRRAAGRALGQGAPRGPRHENFRKFAGRQIKFEYGRIF